MINQPLITKCFASKSRVEYLVPAQSSSAALHTPPASTKAAGYSKQQESPSPIPTATATATQQPGTWVVTAAPTGTEAAEIHFQDDSGVVPAGRTATTTTIPNTKDATAVATSFAFTTPTQQVGGDYNKAMVQQQQAPATIPSSLDIVVLFSLVPLTTSTIPSPTAISTTSSTITTPTTTSSIQYSEPGNAGASFTSGQAVSTFSATVTSNKTLIASAYMPTTFETVVKPTASAFATVAVTAQEEDNVYEG